MKKLHIGRGILILLTFFILFLVLNVTGYSEGTSGFIEPTLLNRKNVVDNMCTYVPNFSKYPFTENALNSVGFDTLYGTSRSLTIYYGEIPYAMHEDYPYRYYGGTTINDKDRPFSSQTDLEIDDQSTDPHLWAMTQTHDIFSNKIGSIGLWIINGLHALSKLAVTVIIWLKGIDLSSILLIFDDGTSEFTKLISSIFLIDTENGTISPFLLFSIVMFLISLVALAFKFIRGKDRRAHV